MREAVREFWRAHEAFARKPERPRMAYTGNGQGHRGGSAGASVRSSRRAKADSAHDRIRIPGGGFAACQQQTGRALDGGAI